jgi:formate hydrogenlyase subunit 4
MRRGGREVPELIQFLHSLSVIVLAPLYAGAIARAEAVVGSKRGPSVLQPYRDLGKLLRKGSAVSDQASWVFRLPCTAFRRFRVRPVAAAGPCLRRIRRPPR